MSYIDDMPRSAAPFGSAPGLDKAPETSDTPDDSGESPDADGASDRELLERFPALRQTRGDDYDAQAEAYEAVLTALQHDLDAIGASSAASSSSHGAFPAAVNNNAANPGQSNRDRQSGRRGRHHRR
ncbi:hypothetical protein [Pseudoscardovia radai]|uniref:hypothetical protein n=1 Tax=Pseudoscardovia radai TaxID=987066 RepID=UPI0039944DDC